MHKYEESNSPNPTITDTATTLKEHVRDPIVGLGSRQSDLPEIKYFLFTFYIGLLVAYQSDLSKERKGVGLVGKEGRGSCRVPMWLRSILSLPLPSPICPCMPPPPWEYQQCKVRIGLDYQAHYPLVQYIWVVRINIEAGCCGEAIVRLLVSL